jgi:hypothetical protein
MGHPFAWPLSTTRQRPGECASPLALLPAPRRWRLGCAGSARKAVSPLRFATAVQDVFWITAASESLFGVTGFKPQAKGCSPVK